MADLKTVHLTTTGMHCGSCAMLIDMTVGDLEGVSEVKTDYASGDTTVTFDPEKTSVDNLVQSVRSAGYEATATT
ncbi:MAG: heavy-metal-associated domain-containing protein [Anaerosomatales bacterium]|nr:heavy-metal-associated domain-containing protein [Anaerosomatales bacterium]MDT8434556.1 heavy-metal-associated domain-containing protein [Anaerosomatales bacterium]